MANIECLEQLKRVVRDAPDDLFDMRAIQNRTHAGTRRCAIGWARVDDWFRENTGLPRVFYRLGPFVFIREGVAGVFGITVKDSGWLFENYAGGRRRGRTAKDDFIAKVDNLIGREQSR